MRTLIEFLWDAFEAAVLTGFVFAILIIFY